MLGSRADIQGGLKVLRKVALRGMRLLEQRREDLLYIRARMRLLWGYGTLIVRRELLEGRQLHPRGASHIELDLTIARTRWDARPMSGARATFLRAIFI